MKRRGGGGLNFHAVRDAAVDIYRPPFLLILLPLLPSFSSGSLTVTDALGISPGVLLSFVAKISGKKSTLSPYERRKEGRKQRNEEEEDRKRLLLSMLTSVSVSWDFLLPFIYYLFSFSAFAKEVLPYYCQIKWNFERKNKKKQRKRERREEKWKRNYLSKSDD